MASMNESDARQYGEAHAAALLARDFKHLGDDIDPSARDAVGALAKELPNPIVSARVDVRAVSEDHAVLRIEYVGDNESTTLESTWRQSGDRYRIFQAKLV